MTCYLFSNFSLPGYSTSIHLDPRDFPCSLLCFSITTFDFFTRGINKTSIVFYFSCFLFLIPFFLTLLTLLWFVLYYMSFFITFQYVGVNRKQQIFRLFPFISTVYPTAYQYHEKFKYLFQDFL